MKSQLFGQNLIKEHHHRILHVQSSLGNKFQHEQTILIFWTKFAQKGISSPKQKKWNNPRILHIQISVSTKLILNSFELWKQICLKKVFII